MGRNMNQLAGNLQGCENVKNFIQLTHQQLSALQWDPSTKLTTPTSSSAGPTASQAPASAPPEEVKCQHPTCTRQFKNKKQMLAHYQIHTPEGQK